jgi:ATP-dependent Clp protease adapter protein ClpS
MLIPDNDMDMDIKKLVGHPNMRDYTEPEQESLDDEVEVIPFVRREIETDPKDFKSMNDFAESVLQIAVMKDKPVGQRLMLDYHALKEEAIKILANYEQVEEDFPDSVDWKEVFKQFISFQRRPPLLEPLQHAQLIFEKHKKNKEIPKTTSQNMRRQDINSMMSALKDLNNTLTKLESLDTDT